MKAMKATKADESKDDPMKCAELVMEEHAILRRGLDVLDGMIRKLEQGERIEIADAITILKFINLFGVEYHQTIEEQILFPALLRATPQESPIRQMLLEHREHRTLVDAVDSALISRRGIEFVRTSRGLTVLFRSHLDREETVLRDAAKAWLSKEEDDAVVAELTKNRQEPENYAHLPRLESKYSAYRLSGNAKTYNAFPVAGG
jgi:hemerythrin-like domain-containing protein